MAEIPEGILKKGGAFGKTYDAQSVEAYITELQLEIADAQGRSKKNQDKYKAVKKELDDANERIVMLEGLLTQHSISFEKAPAPKNEETDGDQTSGRSSTDRKPRELMAAFKKIEELEKELARKNDIIDKMQQNGAEKPAAPAASGAPGQELFSLESTVNDLTSGSNAAQPDAEAQAALQQKLANKELEIQQKTAEVKELQKKVEKLEKTLEKPQSDASDRLRMQIESLKQQLEENNEALSEANDLLESKQKQINELQLQKSAPSGDETLKKQMLEILQRNEMLKAQVQAYQAEAESLRNILAETATQPEATGADPAVLQEFQTKLAAITEERDRLLADIRALEAQLADAVAKIKELESSLDGYEDTKKRLEQAENSLNDAKKRIEDMRSGDNDSSDIEVDMTEIYAEAQRSASQIINAAKKTAEKLRKDTDAKTAQRLQEAEAQAAEIVENAHTSSDKIIADANTESQRIINEATDSVSNIQNRFQEEQNSLNAMVCAIRSAIAKKLDEVSEIAHISSDKLMESVRGAGESQTEEDDELSDLSPVDILPDEAPDDFVYASDEIPSVALDELPKVPQMPEIDDPDPE